MPHDLWLCYLWCLLELQKLSWNSLLPYYLILIYIEPYPTTALIAELLLIETWRQRQQIWALDRSLWRYTRAICGLLSLLIVQQRFAIYDSKYFLIVSTVFCLYAFYQITQRFYGRSYLPYTSCVLVK